MNRLRPTTCHRFQQAVEIGLGVTGLLVRIRAAPLALILTTSRLFVFGNGLPAFRLPSVVVHFLRMRLAADIPARVPVQACGRRRNRRRHEREWRFKIVASLLVEMNNTASQSQTCSQTGQKQRNSP